ncbi:SDR family oxidoreductase [Porticoccaceae bacterium]|nr:SDR family oxidoreductase [Porticoccaceae bacterium]
MMPQLDSPIELFNLKGKSALVVGATGALGEAAARALAGAGARVTLAGGNAPALSALAEELTEVGAEVSAFEGRPIDEATADQIIAAAAKHGDGLDILIAASGTSSIKPIVEMEPDTWDQVMDANVRQTWLLCRSASRLFIEQQRGGKVILISSVRATFATTAGTSAYGTSKAAINMLTRSLAVELGQHQVCVNAIAPTVFRSKLTAWLFEDDATEARAQVLNRIPLGRLGEPADFAGVFLFLSSAASNLVTGEVVNVDGGFSCN